MIDFPQRIHYRIYLCLLFFCRNISSLDHYEVRFLDTGDIQTRTALEVYKLDEQFQGYPSQACRLHLTGIIPADREEEWLQYACTNLQKLLDDFLGKEDDSIFEASVLFTLRNDVISDIMRLIQPDRNIVLCSMKKYLVKKKFGIIANANTEKLLKTAELRGKKIFLGFSFISYES